MHKFLKKIINMSQLGNYKLVAFIIFFILLSFFDIIGITIITPFIEMTFNNNFSVFEKFFSFFNINSESENIVYYFGIIICLIFLIKLILYVFCNYLIFKHCYNNGTFLRVNLLSKYFNNIDENLNKYSNSDLIYRITNLIDKFSQGFMLNVLKVMSELIVGISILILLAIINFKILSISLITLIIIFFIFDLLFNSKLKFYGFKSNISQKNMVNTIKESVMGSKEISVLGADKYFINKIDYNSRNYAKLNIYHHLISGMPRYILELIIISILVISILVTLSFNENPINNISTFSMFGIAALRLAPCATQLIRGITNIKFSINSVDQLYDLYNSKLKVNINLEQRFDSFKTLDLKNLKFYYNKSELIFDDLNFSISKGEKICIIGKSGSGKTTLLDILLGFTKAKDGEFYYNNILLKNNNLENFRSIFSYIPQGFFIIKGTLYENISFDNFYKESKINNVLEQTNLIGKRFYSNPELDEEGTNISGGQKQRISLARSFYFNRDIVILDESTNALDEDTEKAILDNLLLIKKELTLIMVAHKIKSFDYFDKVYEIKDKKLVKIK